MLNTTYIARVEALDFLDNKDLWQKCKVDGTTRKDLRKTLADNHFYVATYLNDELVGVTAAHIREVWPETIFEVHTYVAPSHRTIAKEVLQQHIDFFKHELHCDELMTTTSSKNMTCHNFLIKRLGFKVDVVNEGHCFDDGVPLTIYDLSLKL